MKRVLVLLTAILTLGAAQGSQESTHTLYYLDKTGNVLAVAISAHVRPAAHPRKLTSGGGYGAYSVSPDGTQVIAWRQMGWLDQQFPVLKFFLEKSGRSRGSILGPLSGECGVDAAEVHWTPQGKYLVVKIHQQVETETIIYSLRRHKKVCNTMDLLPDFCADQVYSFVLQDQGDEDYSSALLRVLDLRTGRTAKIAVVNFGEDGEPFQAVWFGKSHHFAFIDVKGNLGAGEVFNGGSKPAVREWMLTRNAHCADLRYISGKGIYFVQKTGAITSAYYSNDLRMLIEAAVLPAKSDESPTDATSDDDRVFSPDQKFYATVEAGKLGGIGTIRVFDKSGRLVDMIKGRGPTWK